MIELIASWSTAMGSVPPSISEISQTKITVSGFQNIGHRETNPHSKLQNDLGMAQNSQTSQKRNKKTHQVASIILHDMSHDQVTSS